jgi:hypothetical protein
LRILVCIAVGRKVEKGEWLVKQSGFGVEVSFWTACLWMEGAFRLELGVLRHKGISEQDTLWWELQDLLAVHIQFSDQKTSEEWGKQYKKVSPAQLCDICWP